MPYIKVIEKISSNASNIYMRIVFFKRTQGHKSINSNLKKEF